jgi:hypothetical protein
MTPEICPSAGRGFTEQHGSRRCWTGNCWNTFPQQRIRLKKQCIAYRVTSIPRQRIQKRFRSHGNEPPTHNNSEECDNSTAEGGDPHTVRPEPTSEREMTNRRQKRTEHRRRSWGSEVKSLVYVVLPLFVVMKCCSYSKTVLQLIVVPRGEYPINRFI